MTKEGDLVRSASGPHRETADLVTVAARLPVRPDVAGWAPSPGGLVTAVEPVLAKRGGIWVGWVGAEDPWKEPPSAHHGVRLNAVRISRDEVDGFYYGFSNGTIWPLYHDQIVPP